MWAYIPRVLTQLGSSKNVALKEENNLMIMWDREEHIFSKQKKRTTCHKYLGARNNLMRPERRPIENEGEWSQNTAV